MPENVIVYRIGHVTPGETVLRIREFVRKNFSNHFGKGDSAGGNQPSYTSLKDNYKNVKLWREVVKGFIWNLLFMFPDSQRYWLRRVKRKIGDLQKYEDPEVVWATGPPCVPSFGNDASKKIWSSFCC